MGCFRANYQDKFIVLGSDGIWDHLDNQRVVQVQLSCSSPLSSPLPHVFRDFSLLQSSLSLRPLLLPGATWTTRRVVVVVVMMAVVLLVVALMVVVLLVLVVLVLLLLPLLVSLLSLLLLLLLLLLVVVLLSSLLLLSRQRVAQAAQKYMDGPNPDPKVGPQ